MSIPCAVLMCHAPIVVPEIGGSRAAECARTTSAMAEAAERLLAHRPQAIALVSPHTPRDRTRFGVCADESLHGSFAQFGAKEVALRLPGAPLLAAALCASAQQLGVPTCGVSGDDLDHGALVPLYFLRRAGWSGPTLLLSLPYPGTAAEPTLGRALAQAARQLGERVCVVASGDMSHRLTRDAPAGYHPEARTFDARFAQLIAQGDLRGATRIDEGLRELAAEDVVDSCAVVAGAVDFDATGHRVLHYEGPFGVGYLEAVLHESASVVEDRSGGDPPPARDAAGPPSELLGIARASIAAHLCDRRYRPGALAPPWLASRGVFVTLRTVSAAELRGCVGHMEPLFATLSQEVAACAAAAATRDTRFSPVAPDELAELLIEISLLGESQAVASIADLDPARYGVVVSSGRRRGVLLPGIDGIHTAREQVRVAAAKAGLSGTQPLSLRRFEVTKLIEQAGALAGASARAGGDHELH
jgi:AmmeMemoRadiSam system protein A